MSDPTPTPTSPDWRALCQELLQPLAEYDDANPYHEHRDLIISTRAALATPPAATGEAEHDDGDDVIDRWVDSKSDWISNWGAPRSDIAALIGEALEHWGRSATREAGPLLQAAELSPRLLMARAADRHDLVRYGVTWDGRRDQPLLTPRPDGYWTPWHIAAQLPQPGAGAMRELRELVEAMHDAFFGNDSELPRRVIQAVNSAHLFLTVHPRPDAEEGEGR